jgi:hypothetical protein
MSLASIAAGATFGLLAAGFQEGPHGSPDRTTAAPPSSHRLVAWKEGTPVRIRVPVASPARELMTAVSFPEETIETAITGWTEADITAIQKRGLLFLRLAKPAEGQLHVLGSSGTHYLLHLTGVEAADPAGYDPYVRITRDQGHPAETLPKRPPRKPSGAIELIQAMRLGLRPPGTQILRASKELALESPELELRVLFVYRSGPYLGFIYEAKNPTPERKVLDASRLRSHGATLILTALRENVLEPHGVTRLYAVFWREHP